MQFLSWLIKEFRPRLAPEGGLKPLSKAELKELQNDKVFMTQKNGEGGHQDGFRMDSLIPISHQEVHKFIQEICSENLFLINLCNEAEEAKDRQIQGNNEQFGLIQKQINQTNETIRVLSAKKNYIESKIKLMSSAKEKDDEANKK